MSLPTYEELVAFMERMVVVQNDVPATLEASPQTLRYLIASIRPAYTQEPSLALFLGLKLIEKADAVPGFLVVRNSKGDLLRSLFLKSIAPTTSTLQFGDSITYPDPI